MSDNENRYKLDCDAAIHLQFYLRSIRKVARNIVAEIIRERPGEAEEINQAMHALYDAHTHIITLLCKYKPKKAEQEAK